MPKKIQTQTNKQTNKKKTLLQLLLLCSHNALVADLTPTTGCLFSDITYS